MTNPVIEVLHESWLENPGVVTVEHVNEYESVVEWTGGSVIAVPYMAWEPFANALRGVTWPWEPVVVGISAERELVYVLRVAGVLEVSR